MNYRAIGDVSSLVNDHVGNIPHDVDLIVGVPRSGMLVASILSLKLNLPLTDLYSFHRNDPLKKGNTRVYKKDQIAHPRDAKKILLIDDSIASGRSMHEAVEMIKTGFPGQVVTMVAFAERHNVHKVDLYLEAVEQPRVFEWNIMHHSVINHACVDLDGVLCAKPAASEPHDDYANAKPLFIPSAEIAHLVTTRPARYRAATEAWLAEHGVRYRHLHMIEEEMFTQEQEGTSWRAQFKASVYQRDPHAVLYVEQRADHAKEIMQITNKPVFCLEINEMLSPGATILALKEQLVRKGLTFRDKTIERLRAYKHAHWNPRPTRK